MSKICFTTESINRFEFIQIGSLSKLETKSLNCRSLRLEIDFSGIGEKPKSSIVGNIIISSNLATLRQGYTTSGLRLKICNSNGHISTHFLIVANLFNHHRVTQMHSATRHQSGQDTEGFLALMRSKDDIKISMCEDNATSMQLGCIWQIQAIKGRQTELIDDATIIRGLVAAPWVNTY